MDTDILENNYWEFYDDQDGSGFDYLSYTSLNGEPVTVKIEKDLSRQVAEIRRCNGRNTEIRLVSMNVKS